MGTIERESQIVDNITSTSAIDALSANQGKVLKDLIDANDWVATQTLYTGSEGSIYGTYSKKLHMATVMWIGNSTSPTGEREISTPQGYIPRVALTVPVRHGDRLYISNVKILIGFSGAPWSGATVTYPTYN